MAEVIVPNDRGKNESPKWITLSEAVVEELTRRCEAVAPLGATIDRERVIAYPKKAVSIAKMHQAIINGISVTSVSADGRAMQPLSSGLVNIVTDDHENAIALYFFYPRAAVAEADRANTDAVLEQANNILRNTDTMLLPPIPKP